MSDADDFVVDGRQRRARGARRSGSRTIRSPCSSTTAASSAAIHRRAQASRRTLRHPHRPAAGHRRHLGASRRDRRRFRRRSAATSSIRSNAIAPSASRGWHRSRRSTRVAAMISAFETPFSVAVVISARPIDTTEPTARRPATPILDSGAAVHVIALRAGRQVRQPTRSRRTRPASPARGSDPRSVHHHLHAGVVADRARQPGRSAGHRDHDRLSGSADTAARDVRVGIRIPGARVRGLGVSK